MTSSCILQFRARCVACKKHNPFSSRPVSCCLGGSYLFQVLVWGVVSAGPGRYWGSAHNWQLEKDRPRALGGSASGAPPRTGAVGEEIPGQPHRTVFLLTPGQAESQVPGPNLAQRGPRSELLWRWRPQSLAPQSGSLCSRDLKRKRFSPTSFPWCNPRIKGQGALLRRKTWRRIVPRLLSLKAVQDRLPGAPPGCWASCSSPGAAWTRVLQAAPRTPRKDTVG